MGLQIPVPVIDVQNKPSTNEKVLALPFSLEIVE